MNNRKTNVQIITSSKEIMAADINNKYKNLPGIDFQPDVYETTDLPEDDQHAKISIDNPKSECIEKVHVDPNEAFKQFKNKNIESSNVDFSDSISASRRTGYSIPNNEYESEESARENESPEQKYQRLQSEIRQLADEVALIKEGIKVEGSTKDLSPMTMTKRVEYLKQQMTDLCLEQQLGLPSGLNLSDPQKALQRRLLVDLDSFRSFESSLRQPTKSLAPSASISADSDLMTYQLFYRPEQAKFSNNARMADLEQRLERIEAVLGHNPNPEKLSVLTSEVANKSITGALSLLLAKVKVLDSSQLDQLEPHLNALQQKMNQVADRKDALENSEKFEKVSDLYQIVKKWDSMANAIPHIVDRLLVMKDWHFQALQFSQTLTHLDIAQKQMTDHLQTHTELLKQIQAFIGQNMTQIETNSKSIDSRLTALQSQ